MSYDSTEMMKSIEIDTAAQLQYEKRVKFKQLAIQKDLYDPELEYDIAQAREENRKNSEKNNP